MDGFEEIANPPAAFSSVRLDGDFDHVPVIDFAAMHTGTPVEKALAATAFRHACTQVGFFYLANHRVPENLVTNAFKASHRYFAAAVGEKMGCHLSLSEHACGYVPMHGERGDIHEAFDVVAEDTTIGGVFLAGDFRQRGNLWPAMPGFRQSLTAYSDALRLLTHRLFGAFALALDLPETYFGPMTNRPTSLLRLAHYPSQILPAEGAPIGVRAHTDHECFTILCQDDVGGLQVRNRRQEWVAVPRIAGTFVVNIGDQMARWSNDRFVSALHRVINTSGRQRYSIPFFVGANADAVIEALPSCVDPEHPSRYPPVIAGDYIMQLIRQGYA